jgi:hypothetical protein
MKIKIKYTAVKIIYIYIYIYIYMIQTLEQSQVAGIIRFNYAF